MPRVRTKICGVKSIEEALVAVQCGADALGFNFWPGSPRYIRPDDASAIASCLHPIISLVGVFVNEDSATIRRTAEAVQLNAVQLHGDETPEFCSELTGLKKIKAFRVDESFDPVLLAAYDVSAVLLDAKVSGAYGGTGLTFHWQSAIETARLAPVILAGGITIANVEKAITMVRPMAIDVCSGVEASPGRKDLEKLRLFLLEVERVNSVGDGAQPIP